MEGVLIKELKEKGIELAPINQELYEYTGKYTYKHLIKRILASRLKTKNDIDNFYNISIKDVFSNEFIKQLPDVDKASDIITDTMSKNGKILLVSDYDVDGVTSAAIGYLFFKYVLDYPIEIIVNKRKYGNGINETLKEQILDFYRDYKFDLLITSDHGSHDLTTLREIKEKTNAEIIVTDHHLIDDKDSPLPIVDAFVNPQRLSNYQPVKDLTGTAVLYFLLTNIYFKLGLNVIKKYRKYVTYLLTYVGMTTISDCVSLSNPYNRVIVKKALSIINSDVISHNPFWSFVKSKLSSSVVYIDETALSFEVIPVLNTPGRIADPRLSFEILTSDTYEKVEDLFLSATSINETRKEMQSKVLANDNLTYSNKHVCVMVAEDSNNIQGIISNRILFSNNYKIAIVFSKQDDNIYKGSGRCRDDDINLKELIDEVRDVYGIKIDHGGHAKAIGIEVEGDIEHFFNSLSELLATKLTEKKVKYIDEIIFSNKAMIKSVFDLRELSPFGIDFEKPIFMSDVYIKSFRIFTRVTGTFLVCKVALYRDSPLEFTMFYSIKNTDTFIDDLLNISKIRILYNISVNTFKGINSIKLDVMDVEVLY